MRPELEDVIDRLRSDSLSSSSEMVQTCLGGILGVASAHEADWREFAAQLYTVRPSLAPFYNLAALIEQNAAAGTVGIHAALASLAKKEREATGAIAVRALQLKGSTFITLSYSGTVLGCLRELAKDRRIRVIVLQSLPMGEGAMTCAKLAQEGIEVEMVDDSMAFTAMAEADHCIVGADAVTPDGVVNKIGTAHLALAARHWHRPCHVVTSTLKVAPITLHDLMASEEAAPYVRRHQVFEITPLELFSGFITDEGCLSPSVMAGLLRR